MFPNFALGFCQRSHSTEGGSVLTAMVYHAIWLFMRSERHFVYIGGETNHMQCSATEALKFSVWISFKFKVMNPNVWQQLFECELFFCNESLKGAGIIQRKGRTHTYAPATIQFPICSHTGVQECDLCTFYMYMYYIPVSCLSVKLLIYILSYFHIHVYSPLQHVACYSF